MAIGSLMDGRNTMAWIQAGLIRAKKMPKLEDMVTKDKKTVVNFEAKSKALLQAYNAQLKAKRKD